MKSKKFPLLIPGFCLGLLLTGCSPAEPPLTEPPPVDNIPLESVPSETHLLVSFPSESVETIPQTSASATMATTTETTPETSIAEVLSESAVFESATYESATYEAPIIEPPLSEPISTETDVSESAAAAETPPSETPSITEPATVEPPLPEDPPATEPSITEPSITEPSITEPSITEFPSPALRRDRGEEAFRLQNQLLSQNNVTPLLWSEALYQIAAQRVMEISNDYSHNQCPDWVAENILMGTSRPDLAVQIWYDSTGHRRNMLAGWTYGAIANYGSFWVSIFSMVEAP